jgi:3-(methylthio)propionyl---CoA ligase
MRGLMMDRPLSIADLIRYAALYHGDTEIVSRTVEGPIHRYGYRDAYARIEKLADALTRLGVDPGDRVATLAWNGHRHFELYYGISGIGGVCHTINPRLFPPQIEYIINHAEDRYIFADVTFIPLLESLAPNLPSVKAYVLMTDRAHCPQPNLPNVLCYEDLIAAEATGFAWPALDEWSASSLCYTSGTTGNPKGVLYSHRSTLLHTFGIIAADSMAITARDTVMPIVPQFHVNAWGIPYGAAMVGAKLVLPGPHLDPQSLLDLMDQEQVNMSAAVPTVWLKLCEYLEQHDRRFSSLKRITCGGSAMPQSLVRKLEETHGIDICHAWGMTEISPVGTMGRLKAAQLSLPREQQWRCKVRQGRPVFGVEHKVIDADGKGLPCDGEAVGELCVRGPWVTSGYYRDDAANRTAFDREGWFRTGDVATIDPDGWIRIVDRTKDLIKSGGEWISSIDVENAALGHPDVLEAAAIAVPHPTWQERPLLVVVRKPGGQVTEDGLLAYLRGKLAKLAVPDAIEFVGELPHTATGKVQKSRLREQYGAYVTDRVRKAS